MNPAQGLVKKPGYFPDEEGGYPRLSLLVSTDNDPKIWSVEARIITIDPESDTPRNLTGHPVDDLTLRAQRNRDYGGTDIYAYRIAKVGYSIDDLADLQAAIKAIKTINRRVDRILGDGPRNFGTYFAAFAEAIGASDVFFWGDRRTGTYATSTYERLTVDEAIERLTKEALS